MSAFEDKCRLASCRSCENKGLMPVLDLGMMPLSDGLLTADQVTRPERKYPLEVAFCPQCSLVQILETVPPEVLFCEDYPYYSSFITTLMQHSRDNALDLIERRSLNENSFVVELASNDGYLLKNFVEKGVPVLGIDPAEGPARAAEEVGVPTLCEFFGIDLAEELAAEDKQADVIIANNVLAHVADTNGFVEGIRTLLKEDGVAVIEVPYLKNLIDHCEFDTIYHEHLCYFSVTALNNLFRRHNLFLNDIREFPIHGGSLRLYVEKKENVSEKVQQMLANEHNLGMDSFAYYQDFGAKVQKLGDTFKAMLAKFKADGKSIAAYGAAAKGAIMLNYIAAGPDVIDFVVDRNIHKQGKFMPGVHIPILAPEKILEQWPDYVVILPWNFRDEIVQQQNEYHTRGGRFIVPVPWPEIL